MKNLSNLDISAKLNELLSDTNTNTNSNADNNSGSISIDNDTYNWLKNFSTKKEVKYETITSVKTDTGLKTVQVKAIKPSKTKKDSLGQTAEFSIQKINCAFHRKVYS